MMIYYYAASRYEGCGHQHKTPEAAARCVARIDPRAPVSVYKRDRIRQTTERVPVKAS